MPGPALLCSACGVVGGQADRLAGWTASKHVSRPGSEQADEALRKPRRVTCWGAGGLAATELHVGP